MSLHLERQHDSEIRDGPCDMYLTGEISGNRLITHWQSSPQPILGSDNTTSQQLPGPPNSSWLMLEWLWKSKNVWELQRT